jgi:hypothetical protein
MADKELSDLINDQAKKSGFSRKDAAKALEKLKKGGMMAQIAPQLQEQFMSLNPNATPRDKLRQKLARMASSRQSKEVKAVAYEKQREQILQEKEKEAQEKEAEAENKLRQARNHRKRLKDLEKKLGTISEEQYLKCMEDLRENKLKEEGAIKRCNNIIELYAKQNEFTSQIDIENDLQDL